MAAIAQSMSVVAPTRINCRSSSTTSTKAVMCAKSVRSAKLNSFSAALKPTSFVGSTASFSSQRRTNCVSSRKSFKVMAYKVAILGAAGGIGQPLALLTSMNPMVTNLALYDIANTPGVAADLSHLDTPAQVKGYVGDEELEAALTGADLVIIPAGVPRKPGMTRDDLFNINAGIVAGLAEGCAKYCPKAILNIISNPVNSTVPIAAEIYKKAGVYDPAKILGVTTLDIVRANTFVAQLKDMDFNEVNVPVIGGHAGITILPLLSQTTPATSFTEEEIEALTDRIQNGGTEVVEAKAGAGSATLSMAYAAARMAESCMRGLNGEEGIVECAYVDSQATELPFFSTQCKLGPNGVEEVMPVPEMTAYEAGWFEKLKPELNGSISKGLTFAEARGLETGVAVSEGVVIEETTQVNKKADN